MYKNFTARAQKVMKFANEEAQRLNCKYIGTQHVLLGLIREGSGVAAYTLKELNVELAQARQQVEAIIQNGPAMVTIGNLPQRSRVKKVMKYAIEEAKALKHKFIGTEHLLLGLMKVGECSAIIVLKNLKITPEQVRQEVLALIQKSEPSIEDHLSDEGIQALKRLEELLGTKEISETLKRAVPYVEASKKP